MYEAQDGDYETDAERHDVVGENGEFDDDGRNVECEFEQECENGGFDRQKTDELAGEDQRQCGHDRHSEDNLLGRSPLKVGDELYLVRPPLFKPLFPFHEERKQRVLCVFLLFL